MRDQQRIRSLIIEYNQLKPDMMLSYSGVPTQYTLKHYNSKTLKTTILYRGLSQLQLVMRLANILALTRAESTT